MAKAKSSRSADDNSLLTPAVAELIAIGAAVGANCEPCFKYHYNEARKLGVSHDDMAKAVELADRVKRAPAQNMLILADKILKTDLADRPTTDPSPESCCSKGVATAPKLTRRKCCD
jgi:AhpD family alkylhydroperoxidase